MRQIYTIALLLLSTSVFSQSALFVNIGQDTGEVREFLESRTYFRSISENSISLWTGTVHKNQEVRYHFFDGVLYAIEDQRLYTDKNQAHQVMEACVTYLEMVDFDTKEMESPDNNVDHYVAITHDRVVEFKMTWDRDTNEYTCSLMVTSRRYGPRMKTESFVSQVNAF